MKNFWQRLKKKHWGMFAAGAMFIIALWHGHHGRDLKMLTDVFFMVFFIFSGGDRQTTS